MLIFCFEGVLGTTDMKYTKHQKKHFHVFKDLKQNFKILQKTFHLCILFKSQQTALDLTAYFLKEGVSFDCTYFVFPPKHKQQFFLDVNNVLKDLRLKEVEKVILVNPINIDIQKIKKFNSYQQITFIKNYFNRDKKQISNNFS